MWEIRGNIIWPNRREERFERQNGSIKTRVSDQPQDTPAFWLEEEEEWAESIKHTCISAQNRPAVLVLVVYYYEYI